MKTNHRLRRSLLLGVSGLSLAALVGPLVVPVPPLKGTVPIEELTEPDSLFLDFNEVSVHYKVAGSGAPVFVLLHGFAASLFSWHLVMQPLGRLGTALAFDRPAFGLTERPRIWRGPNPYSLDFQVDLTLAMLDHLGVEKGVLVGNSAGGTIALATAARHPERVQALILVDPAVYRGGGTPGWIRPLLGTPQMQRLGPLAMRGLQAMGDSLIKQAWHDPGRITPDMLEGYSKPLRVEDWDKALWAMTTASDRPNLAEMARELSVPTLVLTGDDDRIVPTAQSVRLAGEIHGARLTVIPDCGHLPQEERPDDFMQAVEEFMSDLPPGDGAPAGN